MEIKEADRIMTIAEVAEYLRLGEATIYRLAQEGKIPGIKVGRSWRFKKGIIDAWFRTKEQHSNYTDYQLEK